jgi:hypothetical protein
MFGNKRRDKDIHSLKINIKLLQNEAAKLKIELLRLKESTAIDINSKISMVMQQMNQRYDNPVLFATTDPNFLVESVSITKKSKKK